LDLSGCNLRHFSDSTLKSILSNGTNIKTLNLNQNGLGDRGIHEVTLGILCHSSVENLSLDNNNLSDSSSMYSITSMLIQHPHLRLVSLANNMFTMSGVVNIATTFFDCPQVEKINLSGVKITQDVLSDLKNKQQKNKQQVILTENEIQATMTINQLYL